jgi:N-carbamoylputrescine amidase
MIHKLAWIQMPSYGNIKSNTDALLNHCHELADSGAQIILLQELCFTDYFPIREAPEKFDLAMDLEHDQMNRLKRFARERSVFLCVPFFERRAAGLYHNSCAIISNQGELMDLYRKMHIPDDPCFYEKYYFSPGDRGWKVVDFNGLKIGILICWDQWFPEAARLTAMKGADLLYYPTAIAWDQNEPETLHQEQLDSWSTIIRSHSIANGCYSLAVNRVGQEGNLTFWGHSQLCSPSGKMLNRPSHHAEKVIHSIDLQAIEEQRRAWPFFRDRRIDAYQDLSKLWASS